MVRDYREATSEITGHVIGFGSGRLEQMGGLAFVCSKFRTWSGKHESKPTEGVSAFHPGR
jgi:hypothetical protein